MVEQKLSELGPGGDLYLVFGIQGAGKSTWVAEQSKSCPLNAVFFSGPLPSRKHRERVMVIAKDVGCRAIAVWIKASFKVALERNSLRSGQARIKEETMRHVWESLEAPSFEEGFHEIIVVGSEQEEA